MKPTRFEILVAGVAIGCVVASVAVASWKRWPDPEIFGTKGEWVGALASIAAALAAVAIALWSHRRTKIESMTEGAFEVVAAEYVIRKVKAEADMFRIQVAEHIRQLDAINIQISQEEQQIEEAQSVTVSNPSNSYDPADRLQRSERRLEGLEFRKAGITTDWGKKFAGYVEALEHQVATISHVKMAAFDPDVGLAIVKAKALLRRCEGLARLAATGPDLLECLVKILDFLHIAEERVPAAERHIKQVGRGH